MINTTLPDVLKHQAEIEYRLKQQQAETFAQHRLKQQQAETFAQTGQAGCGPQQALMGAAGELDHGMRALNNKLQELRWKLFGDEAKEPSCDPNSVPPSVPVTRSIENACRELMRAHEQAGAILDRI
jgi:hypothetical protein